MDDFASDVPKILMIPLKEKLVLVPTSSCTILPKKLQMANLMLANNIVLFWIGLERRLPVLSKLVMDQMALSR